MKILILGGGLSAAYAWRCCLDNGITPDVIAERIFVPPGGFIYAHWLPKSINKKELWENILITASGKAQGYAAKMWGEKHKNIATSFPAIDAKVRGVNPLKAARALWGERGLVTRQLRVMQVTKEDLKLIEYDYDIIVQTFPWNTESKYKTPIWVVPHKDDANIVLYNGNEMAGYTRMSQLFGFLSYELAPITKEQVNTREKKFGELLGLYAIKGAKLWYAPEIAPDEVEGKPSIAEYSNGKIVYCGRWATNERKFLSHETYNRVDHFIKARL